MAKGVKIRMTEKAVKEEKKEKQEKKVSVKDKEKEQILWADKVILATGGKSYPGTGSTGDGYKIAEKIGHHITNISPSLVPICVNHKEEIENDCMRAVGYTSLQFCKECQGLSLKNVAIQIEDKQKHKTIYEDFGEMLFTHFGISGPIILSASAHLLRYPNLKETLEKGNILLKLDLKPALSEEKLDNRLLRDFEKYKNKEIKNALQDLLPQKLILPMITLTGIAEEKKVHCITKEERKRLEKSIKHLKLTLNGLMPI